MTGRETPQGEAWSSYAALARDLDALRRDSSEGAAARQQDIEWGRVALDALVDRLTAQQADLHQAASALRLRMPLIDPAPSAAADAADALARADAAAETSERERVYALRRARHPRLLPGHRPLVRNAVVYAGCAGVGLVFQVLLILLTGRVDAVTAGLWSLCGLPVIAFFTGYLLIGVVGVPRIRPESAPVASRRSRSPDADAWVDRSPRTGLAICLFTLPVAYLVLILLRGLAG